MRMTGIFGKTDFLCGLDPPMSGNDLSVPGDESRLCITESSY